MNINDPRFSMQFTQALLEKGYATVEGALEEGTVRSVHEALSDIFSLPQDEKIKYASQQPFHPGFTPYGHARAGDTGIPNLLEAWDVDKEAPINWPPQFKEGWGKVIKLNGRLHEVSICLLGAIEDSLQMREGALSTMIKPSSGGIHLIHYPHDIVPMHENARRQSKHFDMSLLTINIAATHPGLKAITREGVEKTDPKGDSLVVMAGKVLEYMTAGQVAACVHTVDNPSHEKAYDRISAPFFVVPPAEQLIEVSSNVEPTLAAQYPSQTFGMMRDNYFKRIFPNRPGL